MDTIFVDKEVFANLGTDYFTELYAAEWDIIGVKDKGSVYKRGQTVLLEPATLVAIQLKRKQVAA